MRKLTLNPEDLKVETFATAREGARASGTVQGHWLPLDTLMDCRTAQAGCEPSGNATCVYCPGDSITCVDCSYTNGDGRQLCAW